MRVKAFNEKNIDFTKQHMFFGEQPNVSRFDIQKFPIFNKLLDKQFGFFWQPEEIDLSKDKLDFSRLSEVQQHIFTSNLKFQTLMDSLQSRSPNLAFLPFVSLPELETLIEVWSAFEALHSKSYQYIMQNIYANPTEIFDDIILNKDILSRATGMSKYYDDFMEYGTYYQLFGEGTHTLNGKQIEINLRELKRKMILCMVSVNILEGVRFFASFACSFAFAENDVMEGNAKIIELIARDENLHLAITQNILKKWRTGEDDPEMKVLFAEALPRIEEMYHECVEEEKAWADYLFANGSILGLNAKILYEYIEYIAGKRLRAIGIKNDYMFKNPLSWVDKYYDASLNQVAPQEVEISSYTSGGIKQDISDDSFKDLDF